MTAGRLLPFLRGEAGAGLALMGAAALALVAANSPAAALYAGFLHAPIGPLAVLDWINDALMAVFFLLVGLDIKRELIVGALASWPARVLPGLCALGGMIVPALVFLGLTHSHPELRRGWAVPSATDIAFALGVLALLGNRVPASLRVFLSALAILDDIGAIVIIGVVYSQSLSLGWLAAALGMIFTLVGLNRLRVLALFPYLLAGAALWVCIQNSGVHATVAGVATAMAVPSGSRVPGRDSPLTRLRRALVPAVGFAIVPLFGFANAGVALKGGSLAHTLTLAVAAGLFLGKQLGVALSAWAATAAGIATPPEGATPRQVYAVTVLCGIGFTMSLFIGHLAFPGDAGAQDALKLGVLAGSLASGLVGAALLMRRAPHQA